MNMGMNETCSRIAQMRMIDMLLSIFPCIDDVVLPKQVPGDANCADCICYRNDHCIIQMSD
jgi:hypothetical protein